MFLPKECVYFMTWLKEGLIFLNIMRVMYITLNSDKSIQVLCYHQWHYIFSNSISSTVPFQFICVDLHRSQHTWLTHWGRVTHICVGKLTIIGSDNGLSPERRQAMIWTSAGLLLIGPLGTNFSEILNGIQTFSFKKMHLKMSSGK